MLSRRSTMAALWAAMALLLVPATAEAQKDCKPALTQAGEPNLLRGLAFGSSLFAWRRAAAEKFGAAYQSWGLSEDKSIDCQQQTVAAGRRWVCTRTARPCSGPGGSAPPPVLTARLQRGDQGEQVRILQELLNRLGYNLTVDGNFGSGTERAVKDFQRKEGLEDDGVVGAQTRDRINAAVGGTGSPPSSGLTARLVRGDEGEQVRILQQLLNRRGYNLTVDGKFGSGTERAVKDFQRKQNLEADGIVGTRTRDRLNA